MENKDFVLLAVAAGKEKALTPVQLQKSLFLISRSNVPEAKNLSYEFEPYHYGPFDAQVYRDAEELQDEGLVIRMPSSEGRWIETLATHEGTLRAEKLQKNASATTVKFILETVERVQSQSFSGLLREIYSKYPEYRENSVFQG